MTPGERIDVEVVARRPGTLSWAPGDTRREHLTVTTPVVRPTGDHEVQDTHHLTVDAFAGPTVWRALVADTIAGRRRTDATTTRASSGNRASFGTPQSLGCVELPGASAEKVWPYTPIGTLVTIEH